MSKTPYTLIYPITRTFKAPGASEAREETITELELRRVNGSDLRAIAGVKDEAVAGLMMIGRLAGIEPKVVDLLDAEDIAGLGTLIAGFTSGGQTTGPTS